MLLFPVLIRTIYLDDETQDYKMKMLCVVMDENSLNEMKRVLNKEKIQYVLYPLDPKNMDMEFELKLESL